jgi:hypothetical protein
MKAGPKGAVRAKPLTFEGWPASRAKRRERFIGEYLVTPKGVDWCAWWFLVWRPRGAGVGSGLEGAKGSLSCARSSSIAGCIGAAIEPTANIGRSWPKGSRSYRRPGVAP